MPSSKSNSEKGVHCWVAAADIDIRRQSFTARRATPLHSLLPLDQKNPIPEELIDDLIADIREGLEETFDRPNCRAPFMPGYEYKEDAVVRAKLLYGLGREDLRIIRVRLTGGEPKINYRTLERYAKDVQYQGTGLDLSRGEIRIICEPFTKANVVEVFQILD